MQRISHVSIPRFLCKFCTAVVSCHVQAPLDFFLRGTVDGKAFGLLEECLGQMNCVGNSNVGFNFYFGRARGSAPYLYVLEVSFL